MGDLRSRGGIPYGYKIVDGEAQIDEKEAEKLRTFFQNYLGGMNMAAAAREAGLRCAATTLPNLLKKKEYAGTSFYPPIITQDELERIRVEREIRKRTTARPFMKKIWYLKIHTRFTQKKPSGDMPTDPAEHAALLYSMIKPITS